MSGIQQMLTGGTYTPPPPTTIGQAYGGGFYAGKIAVGGGGVATHYLIVAPKSTGQTFELTWGPTGTTTGFSSVIAGPTNSSGLAALGSAYQAATFCEGLNIGGYSDWYLPAKNELEVLYYFLKPSTTLNVAGYGSNANAVSPEPISTVYTTGAPAQTASGINFRVGESEAFSQNQYWTSTEDTVNAAFNQIFSDGRQLSTGKDYYSGFYTRAVRRIPV
jgi:hypothetical protein